MTTPPDDSTASEPYGALAPLYDQIMSHVDYDFWAEYLVALCQRFAPSASKILELGCGTGNLSYKISALLNKQVRATDSSESMIRFAESKRESSEGDVAFDKLDFRKIDLSPGFDVVILAYDGLNYLVDPDEVARLFVDVANLLNPNGVFLVDQSTPANSINNLPYFDDAWQTEDESYSRQSEYDHNEQIHTTRFDIRTGNRRYKEIHRQRAYTLSEMELIIKLSSLRVEGCFDAFTLDDATDACERIQWVLTKPCPADKIDLIE